MASMMGLMVSPSSLRAYSTRGGTSVKQYMRFGMLHAS